ncbi:MAG: hypothetical protein V9G14_10600 [Cypionkella sp.]
MPGTYWMHSHVPVQEMSLLAAPLIVRRPEDLTADRQEVVMFLHDFSFRPAAEVLAEITRAGGAVMTWRAMGMSRRRARMAWPEWIMSGMDQHAMGNMTMGGMVMDLNDYRFRRLSCQ